MPSLLIKSFRLYNKRRDAYYFYLYDNNYIYLWFHACIRFYPDEQSNFVPFSLQVNLSIMYRQNGYKNCLQAFLRVEYHVTFKTEKFSRKFC